MRCTVNRWARRVTQKASMRFVRWHRERNWSETTLKVQTHHSYRFIGWATERGIGYAADVTRPVLDNGADLRWIKAMLGHRSVESTQIYTQVSIRALQAVHASTHPAEQPEEDSPKEIEEK